MRKLLFSYLWLSSRIRRFFLVLRGKTENDIHTERILSGKSWEEFCDQLKLAGEVLHYPGTPQDVFNQAEGHRYLARLTRAGLEAFVEHNNPAFPIFRRMVHETVKMGADNPDNYYFNAQISGEYTYRITGNRNSVHYIGFFTQNGNYGTTGGLAPCDVLEGKDLKLRSDGSFEIIVSKKQEGENWLRMEPETGLIIVRQTFFDRNKETPAELHISAIDGPVKPKPLEAKTVDEGLKTASMFVAGAPLLFTRWAKGFQKHTNKLPQFDPNISNAAGGDSKIIYYHSHWKLKKHEALEITVQPPQCDNWNFQVNNYWMESLDYRYFTICINKHSAIPEPDGSIKVVLAHQDPGIPNWLETCGHEEGTMCWRWYRLPEGILPVEPTCKVIEIN